MDVRARAWCLAVIAVVIAACAGHDVRVRKDSIASPDTSSGSAAVIPPPDTGGDSTTVPIGMKVCMDSVNEARAMACSPGFARRERITLYVRMKDSVRKFVDDTGGEAPGGFNYMGAISDSALLIVQSNGHEAYPSWELIDPKSGKSVSLAEWPVFSPDGRRFAIGGSSWDNCSEGNGADFAVWRFTPAAPVREWSMVTQDCEYHAPGRWGAVGLHWRGNDTVAFTRQSYDSIGADWVRRSRPGLLVRRAGRWQIQIDSQVGRPD
jgi:hypothetical protein